MLAVGWRVAAPLGFAAAVGVTACGRSQGDEPRVGPPGTGASGGGSGGLSQGGGTGQAGGAGRATSGSDGAGSAAVAGSGSGEGGGPIIGGAAGTVGDSGIGGIVGGSPDADSGGVSGGAGSVTGTAGSASDSGVLPPGDDCETVADCKLNDDCCTCSAYGRTTVPVECSITDCREKACEYGPNVPHELTCYNGHCEFVKVDCDPTHVTCNEAPPVCASLNVPSVIDGCWGPCTLLGACKDIPYLGADCPKGYAKTYWWDCMSNPCSGGYEGCVKIPEACGDTLRCDCGLDEVCAERGFICERGTLGMDTAQGFCCRAGEGDCSMAP